MKNAMIIAAMFLLFAAPFATVFFQDDFEYSADCSGNLTGNPLRPDCFQLPDWRWSKTNWNEARGFFGVSSLKSFQGNRSILLSMLSGTNNGQGDVYPEADGSFGKDIWISMWLYPDYEAGKLSRFDVTNKWIYAFGTPSAREWCVKIGTRRYLGTMSWNGTDPLPDDHTGLFMSFDQEGCAQIRSGQNLGGNSDYIPMNRWSQLIVHVDTSSGASPNMGAWINANGTVKKVAEHTVTWITPDFTIDRIKLGTTFPGEGQSTNFLDSWIFVDDVKIANSSADIDWGGCPSDASQCDPSDTNHDGCISMTELLNFVGVWKVGNASLAEMLQTIGLWKRGC